MNFKGTYTTEKPQSVIELENRLGITFGLYEKTGSLYGEFEGKKIRLSNHPSKFIENKGGDFDLDYNYYSAEMMEATIKGINRFENVPVGAYIKHENENITGKCYYKYYNQEKGYVEVALENGEIKKYDEIKFKLA